MDEKYNVYGPRGFQSLMEQNPSASDYFSSLPEAVQAKVLKKSGAIMNEDDLHILAQHYMHAK